MQGEVAQGMDQAGFFRHRDEQGGRHFPKIRRMPAHQGFITGRPARAHLDDGLVDHAQFTAFERAPQAGFQGEAILRPVVHFHREEAPGLLACRLGGIEGAVGAAQELVYAVAVVRVEGDADAGIDAEFVAVDAHGLVQRPHRLRGQVVCLVPVGALHQQGEFIAPQAGELGTRGHDAAELHGDRLEQLIADGMAQAVVDHLEVVQIEEQQGGVPATSGCTRQYLCGNGFEIAAVGQAGERVEMGHLQHAVLGAAAAGHQGAGEHQGQQGRAQHDADEALQPLAQWCEVGDQANFRDRHVVLLQGHPVLDTVQTKPSGPEGRIPAPAGLAVAGEGAAIAQENPGGEDFRCKPERCQIVLRGICIAHDHGRGAVDGSQARLRGQMLLEVLA